MEEIEGNMGKEMDKSQNIPSVGHFAKSRLSEEGIVGCRVGRIDLGQIRKVSGYS